MNNLLEAEEYNPELKFGGLIEDLNGDLVQCRCDASTFEDQAFILRFLGNMKAADFLESCASVKARNAATLAVWIVTLGGKPSQKYMKIPRSYDIRIMIELDKASKEDGISRYSKRAEKANSWKLPELAHDLKEIMAVEFMQLVELKRLSPRSDGDHWTRVDEKDFYISRRVESHGIGIMKTPEF